MQKTVSITKLEFRQLQCTCEGRHLGSHGLYNRAGTEITLLHGEIMQVTIHAEDVKNTETNLFKFPSRCSDVCPFF